VGEEKGLRRREANGRGELGRGERIVRGKGRGGKEKEGALFCLTPSLQNLDHPLHEWLK